MSAREPRAVNAVSNVAQCVALSVIQTLAALALDGVLSILLWVIVARNVLILCMTVWGLATHAAAAVKAGIEP